MTLRKLIFWPHLITGCLAGVVVLIMSVTGTLLMYEKQIVAWADEREYRSEPPTVGAARLPVEALINAAKQGKGVLPSQLTLRPDPQAPAMLSYGREGALYIDAYSGAILGPGSPKVRDFFRGVTEWHRWLGTAGAGRPGPRDHRRLQPGVSVPYLVGPLFVDAEEVDMATSEAGHRFPGRISRQSA